MKWRISSAITSSLAKEALTFAPARATQSSVCKSLIVS
jgi:hypothetical protein